MSKQKCPGQDRIRDIHATMLYLHNRMNAKDVTIEGYNHCVDDIELCRLELELISKREKS